MGTGGECECVVSSGEAQLCCVAWQRAGSSTRARVPVRELMISQVPVPSSVSRTRL